MFYASVMQMPSENSTQRFLYHLRFTALPEQLRPSENNISTIRIYYYGPTHRILGIHKERENDR